MKAWELFLPDVQPLVPGAPEPVIEHALRRAAQEFCQKTRAWRKVLDTTTVVADVDEYDIELEPNSELVRFESIKLNGEDLTIVQPGSPEASRLTEFAYCGDGKTLVLNPVPVAEGSLLVTASLYPGNAATGVEDFIYDRYAETIAGGALGKLMQHALKPYTDKAEGLKREVAFDRACGRIFTNLWKGMAGNTARSAAIFF